MDGKFVNSASRAKNDTFLFLSCFGYHVLVW